MAKFQVCPRCEGNGTVANPAFDGMSTSEMVEEMGPEETGQFLTEYTRRGGMYDIACPQCGGQKVQSAEQIADWEDREAMLAEMAAEMRYAGW